MHRRSPFLPILLLALLPAWAPAATPVADWDFTTGTHGWTANHMVTKLTVTPDGLSMTSLGEDPWLEGPRFEVPANALLRVTIEMRSALSASAQIFHGTTFHPERCRSFPVTNDGGDQTYSVMIPHTNGRSIRLRLDPCMIPGELVVRRIRVEAIRRPATPVFQKPAPLDEFTAKHRMRSGELTLNHHPTIWNGLRLQLGEHTLATGYDGELIGTIIDGNTEYLPLKQGSLQLNVDPDRSLTATSTIRDSAGGIWTVRRTFSIGDINGAINVTSTISVDRDREVILLPWLTILPGQGIRGSRKHQGLFAGVEYLSDEPSSSKADLAGPDHVRRVPAPVKITFPLMAVEDDGACIGLIWDQSEPVAAGFDSPDRVFGSNRHAMWLSGPVIGDNRFENDLVAHSPVTLTANKPLTTHATLVASSSPSVLGAVEQYLALRPLPPLPDFDGGFDAAVDLLAHGWLDSDANNDWLFRHAVWMDRFAPQPAADAALYQRWLATQTRNPKLAKRLHDGVGRVLNTIPASDPFASTVSHVRPPVTPLIFGRIPEFVGHKLASAHARLREFDEQGRVIYRPRDTDYAKTHFANHANGHGGRTLAEILEAAVFTADQDLVTRALAILDKQAALYAHTVPRGAQTWEMPLHTPDIMASAHMIRAYVYGYALTGKDDYLAHARYWAWSGVPFLYLDNPTDGTCGPYATIGVLGATNWAAPVWIGQPVQWCGLVYGSALHLLSRFDDSGPWSQLARGITIAGLQMTWPSTDDARQGLLPDYFHLQRQVSDGPAINPGTVNAHLPEAFGKGTLHAFHRLDNGSILHAPCTITDINETATSLRFSVSGWGDQPYHLLLSGVKTSPKTVTTDRKTTTFSHHADQALLFIPLQGSATIEIQFDLP